MIMLEEMLVQHDIAMIAIAVLVCLAGSWSTMCLFRRAIAAAGVEKAAWLVLTSVLADAAIWCTHFIAVLGYRVGGRVDFDPVLTTASLGISTVGAAIGFSAAAGRRLPPFIGGVVVGLAIAAMHYTGMLAYRMDGVVSWDRTLVAASIVFAIVFAGAAVHVAARLTRPSSGRLATLLFALAVVSLHFTAMMALHLQRLPQAGQLDHSMAVQPFALTIASVTLLIVAAGLAIHLIDMRVHAVVAEALEHMSNGLVMIAGDGTIRLVNGRIREMLGLAPNELYAGMPYAQYIRKLGVNQGWEDAETQRIISDIDVSMKHATSDHYERHFRNGTILSIARKPTPDGGIILTYDDVTEMRRGQSEIAHMEFHDVLTGLRNRQSFAEHIVRMSQGGPVALLMLDFDRFKTVNDTLGDAVGDALLIQAAHRLRDICDPSGLLFRLGGDELAFLGRLTPAQAEKLAKSLVAALRRPFEIGDHLINTGLSVGVAVSEPGADPQLVQRMADLALSQAKQNGGDCAEVYSDGMIEEEEQRRRLERDLAAAVGAGQFELHYQPLYELPARKLVGFESLIRWHHPERGLVSPADFIPAAERSGLIAEIGDWVIDEACRQAALWPADIYVAFNVSPEQLCLDGTLLHIAVALAQNQLDARRIEVEITETGIVESSEQVLSALAVLRALGVRVAMDDFGTGYSSLVHIRDFEVDRIKIDRSFVSGAYTDPNSAAVVRAITTMANSMGLATTGEGVEDEKQLALLIEYGCKTAQGYLLSKPLDARAATALIESERARAEIDTPV